MTDGSSMSTTEPDDTSTDTDAINECDVSVLDRELDADTDIATFADELGDAADDAVIEKITEAMQRLAARQSSTDAFARGYLAARLEDVEDRQDQAATDRSSHQEQLADLDRQIQSFTGPVGSRSDRQKRLADIRTGMIRSAEANGRGIRKHRYDIEEMLAEQNYAQNDIPSKPQLRKDMQEIAGPSEEARYDVTMDNQGFVLSTKKREGEDGRVREVLALEVKTARLPSRLESNQVTTGEAGRDRSDGTEVE